jgi:hypothetical protein
MFFAVFFVQVTVLFGQSVNPGSQPCFLSLQMADLYAAETWEGVHPPEPSPSDVVISVSLDSGSKIFVRARDSKTFEVIRGSMKKSVFDVVRELQVSHTLPESPYEAANLLPIDWDVKRISTKQFATLHAAFTTAFVKSVGDAQKRYSKVVVFGGRVVLHAPQYRITYSNGGYEGFEATVDDVPDDRGRVSPLIAWVHQLLAFSRPAGAGRA